MFAFRTRTGVQLEAAVKTASPPSHKERLAIVASGGKLCGIAAYAAALARQLEDAFEVTLFPLDQYLMRSSHGRIRPLADRAIKDVCSALSTFDAVNLQLEYGTLGGHGSDIYRRFCWLADAAPRLSVTFHTLLRPVRFDGTGFAKAVATGRFHDAHRRATDLVRNRRLSLGIAGQLRNMGRRPARAKSTPT